MIENHVAKNLASNNYVRVSRRKLNFCLFKDILNELLSESKGTKLVKKYAEWNDNCL